MVKCMGLVRTYGKMVIGTKGIGNMGKNMEMVFGRIKMATRIMGSGSIIWLVDMEYTSGTMGIGTKGSGGTR